MDLLNQVEQRYNALTPKNKECINDCDYWRISCCLNFAVYLKAKIFLFVHDDAFQQIEQFLVPDIEDEREFRKKMRELGGFRFLKNVPKDFPSALIEKYAQNKTNEEKAEVEKTFENSTFMTDPKYKVYMFYKEFKDKENDCLKFGECVVNEDFGIMSSTKCFLQNKFFEKKVFGYSDAENIKIANNLNRNLNTNIGSDYLKADKNSKIKGKLKSYINENANPEIGECYATIRREVVPDFMPYHIAFVMCKDILKIPEKSVNITTNITIEANAGDLLSRPIFYIYDYIDVNTKKMLEDTSVFTESQIEMFDDLYNRDLHSAYDEYFSEGKNNVKIDPITTVLQKKGVCSISTPTPVNQTLKRKASPIEQNKKTRRLNESVDDMDIDAPLPPPSPQTVVPVESITVDVSLPTPPVVQSVAAIEEVSLSENKHPEQAAKLEMNFFTNMANLFTRNMFTKKWFGGKRNRRKKTRRNRRNRHKK